MPAEKPYLHEFKDFNDLVNVVSKEKAIAPQLIEKDYWIMHSLYGLQQQGFDFELKGGTSLSKGYRIIHRFSEDIDIRIEPPAEMEVRTEAKYKKPNQIKKREEFFDHLAGDISISGIVEVNRDRAFDNKLFTSAGIRLVYPERFAPSDALKRGILLELGFDDTTPNETIDFSSWVMEKATELSLEFKDNRALGVKCYHPGYTFVEKLQAVSTKFRRQQEAGAFPENFLRHYYDLYCLLGDQRVQEFIGTAVYEQRKDIRFRAGDNKRIAENEAFLLTSTETRALYEAEYQKTHGLYYEGMVEFGAILARFQEHMPRL